MVMVALQVVMAVILINSVLMAMPYEGQSDEYQDNLDLLENICLGFFVFEMLVKFGAIGVQ